MSDDKDYRILPPSPPLDVVDDHAIYVQPSEHDVTIANATIFGNDEPPEEPEPPYDHASYTRYGYGYSDPTVMLGWALAFLIVFVVAIVIIVGLKLT